jgi:hypothetical protein
MAAHCNTIVESLRGISREYILFFSFSYIHAQLSTLTAPHQLARTVRFLLMTKRYLVRLFFYMNGVLPELFRSEAKYNKLNTDAPQWSQTGQK